MKTSNRLRIVLDTNVLLVSISEFSQYHWLYQCVLNGVFDVYITNEILTEYEEIIARKFSPEAAKRVVRTLVELENVFSSVVYYKLGLIEADADDNKFVDCAFLVGANFLVTNDKHFNVLRNISFPKIRTVKLEKFKEFLIENNLLAGGSP